MQIDEGFWKWCRFPPPTLRKIKGRSALNPTECTDENGRTPLIIAAQMNDLDAVRKLLVNGANIDYQDTENGWTALHHACYLNHLELISELVKMGSSVTVKDKDGLNAIDMLTALRSHLFSVGSCCECVGRKQLMWMNCPECGSCLHPTEVHSQFVSKPLSCYDGVWTYGRGDYFVLGTGSSQTTKKPIRLSKISSGTLFSVSKYGSAAVTINFGLNVVPSVDDVRGLHQNVNVWGFSGESGRLGLGKNGPVASFLPTTIPEFEPESKRVADISLSTANGAIVTSDGVLWTWGDHTTYLLGLDPLPNDMKTRHSPRRVNCTSLKGQTVVSVKLGEHHAAAITSSGAIFTWGSPDSSGRLGYYRQEPQLSPRNIDVPTECGKVVQCAVGNLFTAFLTERRNVLCVGFGSYTPVHVVIPWDTGCSSYLQAPHRILSICSSEENVICVSLAGYAYSFGATNTLLGCNFSKKENISNADSAFIASTIRALKPLYALKRRVAPNGVSFSANHAAVIDNVGGFWTWGDPDLNLNKTPSNSQLDITSREATRLLNPLRVSEAVCGPHHTIFATSHSLPSGQKTDSDMIDSHFSFFAKYLDDMKRLYHDIVDLIDTVRAKLDLRSTDQNSATLLISSYLEQVVARPNVVLFDESGSVVAFVHGFILASRWQSLWLKSDGPHMDLRGEDRTIGIMVMNLSQNGAEIMNIVLSYLYTGDIKEGLSRINLSPEAWVFLDQFATNHDLTRLAWLCRHHMMTLGVDGAQNYMCEPEPEDSWLLDLSSSFKNCVVPDTCIIVSVSEREGKSSYRKLTESLTKHLNLPRNRVAFLVHESMLVIRSEYFAAMFSSGMQESIKTDTVSVIELPYLSELSMNCVMSYLYGDTDAVISEDVSVELLIASEALMMDELKQRVERVLMMAVCAHTVDAYLGLARQHGAEMLRQYCMEFVHRNLDAIVAAETIRTIEIEDLHDIESYMKSTPISSLPCNLASNRSSPHSFDTLYSSGAANAAEIIENRCWLTSNIETDNGNISQGVSNNVNVLPSRIELAAEAQIKPPVSVNADRRMCLSTESRLRKPSSETSEQKVAVHEARSPSSVSFMDIMREQSKGKKPIAESNSRRFFRTGSEHGVVVARFGDILMHTDQKHWKRGQKHRRMRHNSTGTQQSSSEKSDKRRPWEIDEEPAEPGVVSLLHIQREQAGMNLSRKLVGSSNNGQAKFWTPSIDHSRWAPNPLEIRTGVSRDVIHGVPLTQIQEEQRIQERDSEHFFGSILRELTAEFVEEAENESITEAVDNAIRQEDRSRKRGKRRYNRRRDGGRY